MRRFGNASRSSGSPREGDLQAYVHRGFWQPMDTLRNRQQFEDLWARRAAPWRIWS